MATPILVPRRAGDPHRDRLWAWLRGRLELELPDCPIIEGHHELGAFNRSAALNRAAREAPPWTEAIILDADTYVDAPQVLEAIRAARGTGRLVYPFEDLTALTFAGTEGVLEGYRGSWGKWAKWTKERSPSSALVVPRELWDRVGGFDERFSGWGWEDVAFRRQANELGGHELRVPGKAWHLWHPLSPARDPKRAEYRAAQELGERYKRAGSIELEELRLEARRARAGVVVVLLTNGRREYLEQTLEGTHRLLEQALVERLIVHDDSGDEDFRAWLLEAFAGVDLELVTTERVGFGGAMRSAWGAAAATECPLVFWLEEDFVLEHVPLAAMADLLERRGELAQVVLRRQSWYPRELRAGGLLESRGGAEVFHDVDEPYPHVEHRAFWSSNPSLFRAEMLARTWPITKGSEKTFGTELVRDQPHRRFAFWGSSSSAPATEHVGVERTGHGY